MTISGHKKVEIPVNEDTFIDIGAPESVEIQIRSDGKVIWINVEGRCMFRACAIKELILADERKLIRLE